MNKPAVSDDRINNIINISDNSDRAPLNDKIDEIISDLADKIFVRIKERTVYKDFSTAIGSNKIPFYFQRRIRAEINPYMLKMLRNIRVYIPEKHIFLLLRELLDLYRIRMDEYSNLSKFLELSFLSLREFINRKRARIANIWNRLWHDRTLGKLCETDPVIAVHFSEGIDTGKRSDIHWFPQSQIEPERLLIFINENSLEKKYNLFASPNKQLLKELKASPFKWVFVPHKMLTGMHEGAWASKKIELPQWASILNEKVSDGIDKWILNICKELLYEIEFWKYFLEKFNVKILYYPGEGSTTIIAQGIAYDVLGGKGGFTAGKQRSDIGHSVKLLTAYHTKDIVFTWNNRNPEYFRPPYNSVYSQIVAGHPCQISCNMTWKWKK